MPDLPASAIAWFACLAFFTGVWSTATTTPLERPAELAALVLGEVEFLTDVRCDVGQAEAERRHAQALSGRRLAPFASGSGLRILGVATDIGRDLD